MTADLVRVGAIFLLLTGSADAEPARYAFHDPGVTARDQSCQKALRTVLERRFAGWTAEIRVMPVIEQAGSAPVVTALYPVVAFQTSGETQRGAMLCLFRDGARSASEITLAFDEGLSAGSTIPGVVGRQTSFSTMLP